MSWGIRITILYLSFVLMIGTLVFLTSRETSELVSDDYYQQELNYQQTIDRSSASASLVSQPQLNVTADGVKITFPSGMEPVQLGGHVLFLRPSDAKLDRKEDLHISPDGTQLFSRDRFITGLYMVKMDWQCGEKKYYNEYNIYLP